MTIKNFLVNTNHANYTFGYVAKTDTFGGVDYTLHLDPYLIEDLRWLRDYRKQLAREEELRRDNPAAAEAYLHYRTVLNLVAEPAQ